MRNIILILFCSLFSCCKAQNPENRSDVLLDKIYKNRLQYFNTSIVNKDNYAGIGNLSKEIRSKIIHQTRRIINSDNFFLLEGFSPSWGNYIGVIWNNDAAYAYKRSSTDRTFRVTRINLDEKDLKKIGLDFYIINRVNHWDVGYINGLKHKIGFSVLDGYNFIATRIKKAKQRNPTIETISFEQFVEQD